MSEAKVAHKVELDVFSTFTLLLTLMALVSVTVAETLGGSVLVNLGMVISIFALVFTAFHFSLLWYKSLF